MFNFLRINTKRHLRRNKSARENVPYTQAKTVGIIFTVEDMRKHNLIKELIKKLEHDGKKASVVCHLPKDKQNYEFLFDFFTGKDVSFWGNNTSEAALKFSSTAFDYLLYLDTEPNPLILNLLAQSKAKCRIGKFWEEGRPYFELMIENMKGVNDLIDGIYKYTSLLR